MSETTQTRNEVQELSWALVDEQASQGQIRRLEELLLTDREARRVYTLCMQMHADLYYLLGHKKPMLPPALEKAIKRQQNGKTPPLPMVDLPLSDANAHHTNGML